MVAMLTSGDRRDAPNQRQPADQRRRPAGFPTVAEFLPGDEASTWFGVGMPRNPSAEIIDKLNKEINSGLADPKMKARISELGACRWR
jgi:tripartite-type tricarboxylate transporter receptor subunit TctC